MSNPVTPLSPLQAALAQQHALNENYFIRAARELDVMLNVDTDGLPDETISARWARWATQEPKNEMQRMQKHFGIFACHALNIAQPDHGDRALYGDQAHAEKVVETEKAAEAQVQ